MVLEAAGRKEELFESEEEATQQAINNTGYENLTPANTLVLSSVLKDKYFNRLSIW